MAADKEEQGSLLAAEPSLANASKEACRERKKEGRLKRQDCMVAWVHAGRDEVTPPLGVLGAFEEAVHVGPRSFGQQDLGRSLIACQRIEHRVYACKLDSA